MRAAGDEMGKRMLAVGVLCFATIVLSGCVGLVLVHPAECENETPSTRIHDLFVPIDFRDFLAFKKPKPPPCSSKEEFLKEWGKPKWVSSTAAGKDLWTYERPLWCGVIPIFLLPVPLVLPVCNGFDRIEFEGDEGARLHTRRTVTAAFFIGLYGGGGAGADPACFFPLPAQAAKELDAAKPVTHLTP
jgi:hypothetical protein